MPALLLAIEPRTFVLDPADLIDLEGRVLTLLDVSAAVREDWLTLQVTATTLDALADDDLLPLHATMQVAFDRLGDAAEIDSRDAETVVYGLLNQAITVEDVLLLSDYLSQRFSVQPQGGLPPATAQVHLARERLLELLVVGAGASGCMAPDLLSIGCTCASLDVSTELIDVEALAGGCALSVGRYRGALQSHSDFLGLLRRVAPEVLIDVRPDKDLMATAVRIQVLQSYQLSDWSAVAEIHVAQSFVDDLARLHAVNTPSLLRKTLEAAAEVVTGSNPRNTHALRTGPGTNDPITSGDWEAQRHDVDNNYHLHYWRHKGGRLQLANVGPHNSFNIGPVEQRGDN